MKAWALSRGTLDFEYQLEILILYFIILEIVIIVLSSEILHKYAKFQSCSSSGSGLKIDYKILSSQTDKQEVKLI
jgi:hypothetical protein